MTDQNRRDEDHWSLDKRVPVVLIFAILAQVGTSIWWFSALNQRVDLLEKSEDKSSQSHTTNVTEMQNVKDRVLKVEISLSNIDERLAEIKEILVRKTR